LQVEVADPLGMVEVVVQGVIDSEQVYQLLVEHLMLLQLAQVVQEIQADRNRAEKVEIPHLAH
jgi:hypothetical protein